MVEVHVWMNHKHKKYQGERKMGKEEGDGIQNTHENVRTTKFYKLLHLKLEMSLHACLLVIRAEKSFQKG